MPLCDTVEDQHVSWNVTLWSLTSTSRVFGHGFKESYIIAGAGMLGLHDGFHRRSSWKYTCVCSR